VLITRSFGISALFFDTRQRRATNQAIALRERNFIMPKIPSNTKPHEALEGSGAAVKVKLAPANGCGVSPGNP
jgi:hypothetical protein